MLGIGVGNRSFAMSLVNVTNVTVLNNPATFNDEFQFEVDAPTANVPASDPNR